MTEARIRSALSAYRLASDAVAYYAAYPPRDEAGRQRARNAAARLVTTWDALEAALAGLMPGQCVGEFPLIVARLATGALVALEQVTPGKLAPDTAYDDLAKAAQGADEALYPWLSGRVVAEASCG